MPTGLPAHVEWLATHRSQDLQKILRAQGVQVSTHDALAVMMAADPSPGAHAVQWLCDGLIAGTMRWEDISGGGTSKAGQTLLWFARYRRSLAPGQRNLEEHAGLGSLYRAVEPMLESMQQTGDGEPTGRAARRLAREGAHRDSIIVCNTPELTVAIPLTRAASCWWGQGTRWCTAGREDNMFDHYNAQGPLVVVCLPRRMVGINGGGEQIVQQACKLQLHVGQDGELQFMDEVDEAVSTELVRANWDVLEAIMTWAGQQGGDLEYVVPTELWHGAVADAVLARNGALLDYVAVEHRTQAMCLAAVRSSPDALAMVPSHLCTPSMYGAAVKAHGGTLKAVPSQLRTAELCLAAVQSDGNALRHVPDDQMSEEIILAAVSSKGMALQNSAYIWRTPKIYAAAVAQDGYAIQLVGRDDEDPELSMLAVRACGDALKYVPHAHRTPGLLMAAIESDGNAIHHVEPHDLTAQLCLAAVEQDPNAIRYIPAALRTRRVCMTALAGNGWGLCHLDAEERTAELCTIAVGTTPNALYWVPDNVMVDDSLYMIALQGDPRVIKKIPSHLMTPAMAHLAVAAEPSTLAYVEDAHQSIDMCAGAVAKNPYLIRYVSRLLRAQVEQAVEDMPPALETPSVQLRPDWLDTSLVETLRQCLATAARARTQGGSQLVGSAHSCLVQVPQAGTAA